MVASPADVGIVALEVYFPSQYVEQAELEKYDGVGAGKYTIGLGQTRMSFCDDREDTNSIALTTLTSLLRKYTIDPSTIGRLEVGTETILDKSKSCKSVLMQIFEAAGNTDIEGIDNLNACYGGTNAIINSVNWIQSPSWDGRLAIVIDGDIALYDQINARPTGGVGCVAMLIGPQAPLVLEPTRGTCIRHVYDFYKPDFKSEYPHVDGQLSIRCYLDALDASYGQYFLLASNLTPRLLRLKVFHSPTCKLVTKAYARLLYLSYLSNPDHEDFASISLAQRTYLRDLSPEASLTDKQLEKTFLTLSQPRFQARVQPSLTLPTMCGNMYCASVYGALISLFCGRNDTRDMIGKRVGIYSYGGGLAATFLSIRIVGDVGKMVENIDLEKRLEARVGVSVENFIKATQLRENICGRKGYEPQGETNHLQAQTYYLSEIDEQYQRIYKVQ